MAAIVKRAVPHISIVHLKPGSTHFFLFDMQELLCHIFEKIMISTKKEGG
jgi:hypothetical protein